MYAEDFEYADEKLSDYGMMICQFDDAGLETLSSGSDITFNQIPINRGRSFSLGSAAYDTAVTATFQICKDPYLTDREKALIFSAAEISSLQRWLCRNHQYHRFKIDQEGFEHIYWNGTFSAKQIELNGQVIGMELTLYTDAPYAYMDEICIEITEQDLKRDSEGNYLFDLYDVSDEEGYRYPDMEITILNAADTGAGCKFVLTNSLDPDRPLIIKHCSGNEVIKINGGSHTISSSANRSLANDFNYCFPRIINSYTENKNTFTASLNCKIKLSYSPIRKVGF